MRFTKMQGLGNDYVYVDCTKQNITDRARAAIALSDRHTGVGADGLICICSSNVADFRMDMYNADGSRAEMCGNGIRCVGKFVYDKGLTHKTTISVETLAGIRMLTIHEKDGQADQVAVDMGAPVFEAAKVPVVYDGTECIDAPVTIGSQEWRITCVSMGNPHTVVFVPRLDDIALEQVGPQFEHAPLFPNRVNTEFVEVLSPTHLRMRVWERGSGETYACGTGACAVLAAAVRLGHAQRSATVTLLGGDLLICWEETSGHIRMSGPAVTVFEGELAGRPDWL